MGGVELCHEPIQRRAVVIPERYGLKPVFEPVDGGGTVRAAIDEVTDAEQPVAAIFKVKFSEGALEVVVASLDVTADEVAAVRVAGDCADAGGRYRQHGIISLAARGIDDLAPAVFTHHFPA